MSKMNNKMRLSITIIILVPVFILGALAIFSNTAAISNLKKVNKTAMTIADEHMVNISELSEIEKELQEIHKKSALAHHRDGLGYAHRDSGGGACRAGNP